MTRFTRYALFFFGFWLGMNAAAFGKKTDRQIKKAQSIVKQNATLADSVGQLLVVFNNEADNSNASIVAFEKKGENWIPAFEIIGAGIGRKGFAAPGEKREGDQKSPSGFFRLGQLFGYDAIAETHMPYQQVTADDKWIDDQESPDYNKHVKGATTAKSFENLKISSDEYKLCMVIEYNTSPVVKGMGSAIFMHLSYGDVPNSSSGCVVVTPENMAKLLKWMRPEAKPSILMGTEKVLCNGLK